MNINLVSLWDEIKDKKIVVYDLETTGFKSKNTRILSFSAIRYQVTLRILLSAVLAIFFNLS